MPEPDADLSPPWSHPLRLAELPARKPTRFRLAPDAEARDAIAAALGLSGLDAIGMQGELRPTGRDDWELAATLTASVTQPCIVTLAPVITRIEETIFRRYLASMEFPTEEETEMPEDDTAEPLPAEVDLGAVMVEALALALPQYPRTEGVEFAALQLAEAGVTPMTDDALKPFAGLAALLGGTREAGDDEE
ncbi:MAG: DUF177 domain-containing protein [Rhodobacteraceae bacterium]|nr:DUF177 domain-containing protein [Paracoccaceae bacterium]